MFDALNPHQQIQIISGSLIRNGAIKWKPLAPEVLTGYQH